MGDLYWGDNLDILRNYVASESVDLIYLDPPFNKYLLAAGSGLSTSLLGIRCETAMNPACRIVRKTPPERKVFE